MIDLIKEEEASRLRGSFLEFTRFFFKLITNRDFVVSQPIGRESHQIVVCRELTRLFRLEVPEHRLLINLPPGHGKSVLVSMWIAWSLASYSDSNYMYISYSHELASKHTAFIKSIVSSKMYEYLFGVKIKQDSRAKDHFVTEAGGTVRAFGSSGSITGSDAGLPALDRFSGCVIIDDPIKPDDVHSDTIRESVIRNYEETIRQRARGENVSMIFIGQRLHEDDLAAYLMSGRDTRLWQTVILQGLDSTNNALYPEVMPYERLVALQEKSPYVFASQYQQDPLPAGGGLFKSDWFVLLDEEPQEFLTTFICADTAETDKSWNDATVFSFFGVYEVENFGRKTGVLGIHWLDCVELRIEPKDLKDAFVDFYGACTMHPNPPLMAAIEKKSTGVTLVSVLKDLRGMAIREIERTKASGSKTQRFLEIQPYIASRSISLPTNGKHTELCLKHMAKITANDTHRHDDIADTLADAIRLALIEKTLYNMNDKGLERQQILKGMNQSLRRKINAGAARNG